MPTIITNRPAGVPEDLGLFEADGTPTLEGQAVLDFLHCVDFDALFEHAILQDAVVETEDGDGFLPADLAFDAVDMDDLAEMFIRHIEHMPENTLTERATKRAMLELFGIDEASTGKARAKKAAQQGKTLKAALKNGIQRGELAAWAKSGTKSESVSEAEGGGDAGNAKRNMAVRMLIAMRNKGVLVHKKGKGKWKKGNKSGIGAYNYKVSGTKAGIAKYRKWLKTNRPEQYQKLVANAAKKRAKARADKKKMAADDKGKTAKKLAQLAYQKSGKKVKLAASVEQDDQNQLAEGGEFWAFGGGIPVGGLLHQASPVELSEEELGDLRAKVAEHLGVFDLDENDDDDGDDGDDDGDGGLDERRVAGFGFGTLLDETDLAAQAVRSLNETVQKKD